MDYAMSKQHFFMRYFFNFCSISIFLFHSSDAWGCHPFIHPLHALALNESDEQLWKVLLHHLR